MLDTLTPTSSTTQPGRLSERTITQLRDAPILCSLDDEKMHCLDGASVRHLLEGELLVRAGDVTQHFWILLDGALRLSYVDGNGNEQPTWVFQPGASFGEVPLLAGIPSPTTLRAIMPVELLELTEDQFWALMTACPAVRKAVLGNMAMRLNKMQSATFQQEKMAALGTLAAGLMHELNNPGAAARRAAVTLRENFTRLHRLTSRFARISPLTEPQMHCLVDMQEHALEPKAPAALSTIEQNDAEEALADWMQDAGIKDAWKLAPAFVSVGIGVEELDCARHTFPHETFSDALNWLEALVSNQQLVGIVEESIGRVTDLVHAVKSYAYEGRGGQRQEIDINHSVHATLVILGHKMREKQIILAKEFGTGMPMLEITCQGINQVWTNLLDNAIDAVPQGGRIAVRTWGEEVTLDAAANGSSQTRMDLCIAITDNGPGIPLDAQPHIFDPFFTTKAVGVGTGLGLGIVYRIVEQCNGVVHFSSMPGETEFIVRLPARRKA